MRQLRRSGLFVAKGSYPAKSPVGATFSASMPLLRSFGFLPFSLYKYAAPMGLKKDSSPLIQWQCHPGPLPQERENWQRPHRVWLDCGGRVTQADFLVDWFWSSLSP